MAAYAPKKPVQIWIENADGNFVEIGAARPASRPQQIVCVPTPSKDGFHYVPDWYDLTHFG